MDSNVTATGVHCLNCGAEFESHEARCPYCGTMYEPGAEKQYMRKLGDIREDMEDLNGLALSETKSELKAAAKSTLRTIVIIIVAILLLSGILYLWDFVRWWF
ncbi:hypothetical protein SAMN02910292_01276 [Lachnospiraceae bacterium XBB2008]|nr:hypothetical protein SAMN02910292_01276 [Lachnospiraceae bacterium XBB2008]